MSDRDRPTQLPSEPSEIAILWSGETVRCVLLWDGNSYRLRLYRGEQIVNEQVAADDAVLFAIARRWRREYEDDGALPSGGG